MTFEVCEKNAESLIYMNNSLRVKYILLGNKGLPTYVLHFFKNCYNNIATEVDIIEGVSENKPTQNVVVSSLMPTDIRHRDLLMKSDKWQAFNIIIDQYGEDAASTYFNNPYLCYTKEEELLFKLNNGTNLEEIDNFI